MHLLFDFDSTLVRDEGLDALFQHSLTGARDRERRIREFQELTDRGMAGELPFDESLSARLALLDANRSLVEEVGRRLLERVTPSVERNRSFFREWPGGAGPGRARPTGAGPGRASVAGEPSSVGGIHIVSGGFGELIRPTAEYLGIPFNQIHAHRFRYDPAGRVLGLDPTTALARGGKERAVRELGLPPARTWMVGDGATDLELRELGLVGTFVAFVENRHRPPVVQRADRVVSSMEELLELLGAEARAPGSRSHSSPDSPANS